MSQCRRNQGSSRPLIAWLEQAPFNILSSKQCKYLDELCQLLDEEYSNTNGSLKLMIEVHHDDSGLVDFSIYCNREPSISNSIVFPEWIQQWLEQVEISGLRDAFPRQYWLEFDDVKTAYRLMGLFQKCNPIACEPADFLELITRGGRACASFLASTIASIGVPTQLGLIDRWEEYVKLVIPLRGSFKEPLAALMSERFSSQLSHAGIDPESLAEVLQRWSVNNRLNLSVDCSLVQDQPGQRLCFELMVSAEDVVNASAQMSSLEGLFEMLCVPTEQLCRFWDLRNNLPYASRRPRFNLVEQELLWLGAGHAKVCLGPSGIILKDYLSLSSSPVSSESLLENLT